MIWEGPEGDDCWLAVLIVQRKVEGRAALGASPLERLVSVGPQANL